MARRRNGTNGGSATADKPRLSAYQERVVEALSVAGNRLVAAARFGETHSGNRDVYGVLGYPQELTWDHYYSRYLRQDVARAVVDIPVNACWRQPGPSIPEGDESDQAFVDAWSEMERRLKVHHYMVRVDKLARIGLYAGLYLGYNDGLEASAVKAEVGPSAELQYLQPFAEPNMAVDLLDEDRGSTRYGQPLTYKLTVQVGASTRTEDRIVHWSRLIHIAEDTLDNDLVGTPALQSVFNRLIDLDKIAGGSAEMFWASASRRLALEMDKEIDIENPEDFDQMVFDYIHDISSVMRLKGIKANPLNPAIVSPADHLDSQLALVSVATRIPKRILMGSERGELASSQDRAEFAVRMGERQSSHCEPNEYRALVDRLILNGTLPTPAGSDIEDPQYPVNWPDQMAPSLADKAEVAERIANAISKYGSTPGAELVLPVKYFREWGLLLTPEQVEALEADLEEMEDDDAGVVEPTGSTNGTQPVPEEVDA